MGIELELELKRERERGPRADATEASLYHNVAMLITYSVTVPRTINQFLEECMLPNILLKHTVHQIPNLVAHQYQ